jgi:hypothetical protein
MLLAELINAVVTFCKCEKLALTQGALIPVDASGGDGILLPSITIRP